MQSKKKSIAEEINHAKYLEYRGKIEIADYKRAPLKGSGGTYDHIATLRMPEGVRDRFFVCFAEAGKAKDALFSSAHIKDKARKDLKEQLVETGKIKPSLYIEEAALTSTDGAGMHTWLQKIGEEELWRAALDTIIEYQESLFLKEFQVTADIK